MSLFSQEIIRILDSYLTTIVTSANVFSNLLTTGYSLAGLIMMYAYSRHVQGGNFLRH